MKLIESFDTWSNNHFQKTSRASKPSGTLNESDDMFTKIMESIKSSMAYAKATSMMKKWEAVSKAANADIIALAIHKKAMGLSKQLEPLANAKANAKGDEAKKPYQAKIDNIKTAIRDIAERGEELKQQATNEKDAFKEKLDDLQKDMKDPFTNLFAKQLSEITRIVSLDAAKAKGELATIKGNETAAAAAKEEAVARAAELDKIRKDLADGKDVASDDLEELDEIKPFITEINKVQAAKQKLDTENAKIDGATASSVETAAGDDESAQKSALDDLKTKLGVKKTAQEGLWDAKKALYDKVKASNDGVTKTMISLAGGVADKAEKSGDNKWKIVDLNSSWGKKEAPSEFIDKDGYTKSTQDEIDKVETKLRDPEQIEGAQSAVDVAKEALGDQFDSYEKIDNPEEKEPDTTDANGDTVPGKKKWKDVKTFKGKDAEGADTAEEVIYAKPNDLETTSYSPNVSGAYQVSESIAARFKRAMDQRGPRF